jgi:hypothetical protein
VDDLEPPEDFEVVDSPDVEALDPDPSLPELLPLDPDESPELSPLEDEVSPVAAPSFFAVVGLDDDRLSVL